MGNVKIQFEIEPVVKVTCKRRVCKYHLGDMGFDACCFKYITIGDDELGSADCRMMEFDKEKMRTSGRD